MKKRLILIILITSVILSTTYNSTAISVGASESNKIHVENLETQLNMLYKQVGKQLNIEYKYVKLIHVIAGGKAVYADKMPNIFNEETVRSSFGPFDIDGANPKYSNRANWVICDNDSINRPSKYYMPDAAYSVTEEIVQLMNKRYSYYENNKDYNDLKKSVKNDIIFYEAVLEYTGSSENTINGVYKSYKSIIDSKVKMENIIESGNDGKSSIKEQFKNILNQNGISDERELRILSVILSFDNNIAENNSISILKSKYSTPYKIGVQTRENMMIAAMSIVGKCRYVWGGGHLTSSNIRGINPMWELFDSAYSNTDMINISYNQCIKPDNSWCPIHGINKSSVTCLEESLKVYSIDEYLNERKNYINVETLRTNKFNNLLTDAINFSDGVKSHRLDGLDCSGYTSWVMNQIDTSRNYDSGARQFISSSKMEIVDKNSELYSGDIFSWGEHIVIIVGKVEQGNRAYVILEASPPEVKFGILVFNNTPKSQLNEAYNVANDANKLLGNSNMDMKISTYNVDAMFKQTGEEEVYAEFGRYTQFKNDDKIIQETGKSIKQMTAREIIQYIVGEMPNKYVSGIQSYSGKVFDTHGYRIDSAEFENKNSNKNITCEQLVDIKE